MYPCMHKTLLKNSKEKSYHLKEREPLNSTIKCSSLVPSVRDHLKKHLINEDLVFCNFILIENFAFMVFRQHFLQCPQGLLNKHFEKLIQCDMRLNFLSRQPEIVVDSPFFEPRPSVFEDPEESKEHSFDQMDSGGSMSGFQDVASPTPTQSSSLKIEHKQDSAGLALENRLREAPSPSSGTMSVVLGMVNEFSSFFSWAFVI